MAASAHEDTQGLPLGMIGRSTTADACHTCIFYSQPDLGSRVLPHVEEVVRSHRRALGFQFYLWPFDVLDDSPFAERARNCTATADVVVIATDGDDELPDSFRQWLDTWQQKREGRGDRLVALFHAKSPDTLPVPRAFRGLADFAVSSGVGFIWSNLPDQSNEQDAPPFTAAG